MAARTTELPPGAVFHSDRGSNYTSGEFAGVLEGLGIRQSVGRTGICFDNALAAGWPQGDPQSRFRMSGLAGCWQGRGSGIGRIGCVRSLLRDFRYVA